MKKKDKPFICPFCHAILPFHAEKCHHCRAFKFNQERWFPETNGNMAYKGRHPNIFYPKDLDHEYRLFRKEYIELEMNGWEFHHNHYHFVNKDGDIRAPTHGYNFSDEHQAFHHLTFLAEDRCGIIPSEQKLHRRKQEWETYLKKCKEKGISPITNLKEKEIN